MTVFFYLPDLGETEEDFHEFDYKTSLLYSIAEEIADGFYEINKNSNNFDVDDDRLWPLKVVVKSDLTKQTKMFLVKRFYQYSAKEVNDFNE